MLYNRFMPKENIIGIVKRKLWASGYNVRSVYGIGLGCDLLVEGKHRVRVFRKGSDIAHPDDDILAIVSRDAAKRAVVVYVGPPNRSNPTVSPRAMFGIPTSKKDNHGKKNKEAKGGKEAEGKEEVGT